MTKNLFRIGMVLLVFTVWHDVAQGARHDEGRGKIEVLLAYHPALAAGKPCILEAYQSVLQEEGIPFRVIDVNKLISLSPPQPAVNPAILFPDGINQILPKRFNAWIKKYLEKGGDALIGYDAGTKDQRGRYMNRGAFADYLGLDYILYNQSPQYAYTSGSLRFTDKTSAEAFEIPPGKTNENNQLVGYQYGILKYPFARTVLNKKGGTQKVWAYMEDKAARQFPAIVENQYGKGTVLYASFPLGYLKCHSDDLLLRLSIRFLLFKSVKMPHLVSVPGAKGGLVINWHVDSNVEWVYLPLLKKKGYFRDGLKYSIHITAGDSQYTSNDGSGFNASEKGHKLVEMVMSYGTIGSHGGWAHDWFAGKVASGEFKEKEIEEFIAKNNQALEKIVGYKIREYSAPAGVHPQPLMTKVLERLGMIAYYYTGDLGSSPNRTFADGNRVSEHVIAFPVTNFGDVMSLEEMKLKGNTPEQVYRWLTGMADYATRNRVVRVIYSHPRDLKYYPKTFSDFLDYISSLKNNGKLRVQPMSDEAEFLLNFLKTTCDFIEEGASLKVYLKNPMGLKNIAVAIPKKWYKKGDSPLSGLSFDEDENYFYLTVQNEGITEKTFCLYHK